MEVEATVTPASTAWPVQPGGGLALLLPPDDGVAESPDELLDMLDGLVISGGSDIDPRATARFPPADPALGRSATASSWRSRTEALERDMPVLGICRGMEMLNVALGGTLEQHIERLDVHLHAGGLRDHAVRLEPNRSPRASGRSAPG